MKFTDKQITAIIGRSAGAFRSGRGRVWNWVGASLRECILDAEVMDHIRLATAYGDIKATIDAEELLKFRKALELRLGELGFRIYDV